MIILENLNISSFLKAKQMALMFSWTHLKLRPNSLHLIVLSFRTNQFRKKRFHGIIDNEYVQDRQPYFSLARIYIGYDANMQIAT